MRLSLYSAKRVCPSADQARDRHWRAKLLNHVLALKIPDFDGGSSSCTEPVAVGELRPEVSGGSARADPPQCLSLAWSADGQTLFAGYSDNLIRVWQVSVAGTR